jgi:hypothetical protein
LPHFFIGKLGIQLFASMYTIDKVDKNFSNLEEGFETEGGLYKKDVELIPERNLEKKRSIKTTLLAT